MAGFFKLWRGWRDCPALRGDYSRADAWVWLIENACWQARPFDVKGKSLTLERGQLCASRDQLASVWGWSPSAVERFLTRLKTEQMIGRETGQGKTVITISNYDKYQDSGDQVGQEIGQQTGQASDRHRTAKEEGKKVKKEKDISPNGDCASSDALTAQEIMEGWNELASQCGLSPIIALNAKRRIQIRSRLREYPDIESWQAVFRNLRNTPWLLGDNEKGWRADFDFLLQPKSFLKLLENSYAR